jgi:speckle-type POZ protein
MRPDTFRALLHFIYTDSLPAMSHLRMDEMRELVQHLLAAANRYATDRLKVMCEHILARTLHVENAATTLVLADRHGCDRLKHASIHFMSSSSDKSKMGEDVATGIEEDNVISSGEI